MLSASCDERCELVRDSKETVGVGDKAVVAALVVVTVPEVAAVVVDSARRAGVRTKRRRGDRRIIAKGLKREDLRGFPFFRH
jgi:hypothetical protein